MVDFNNDITVSAPAANLVKVLVLEARYNALLALEDYNNRCSSGVRVSQATVRSRLGTWLLEHLAYLERTRTKQEELEKIEKMKAQLFFNVQELEKSDLLEVFYYLNEVMDKLRITKLDTKIQYDTTNIETDNKVNQYA